MIVLPIITLIVIFICYWFLNDGHFGVVNLLILTYILMCSASLVLTQIPVWQYGKAISFEPMLYLSVCFIIIFWGFSGFRDKKLISIKIERIFLYRTLEYFLLLGGFLSILFFLPVAATALGGDISLNRYEMVATGSALADFGIINSIFSLMSNLFIIAQVCSFINLIPINGKRHVYKAYLLLLSSLSFVVYVLAYVGRDGVVYWLMSYIFCFLLFRKFLMKNNLKKMKRTFAFVFVIIMIPFLMISISRFSGMAGGTVLGIINYAGQQLQNFNDHFQIEAPLLYGRHTFPIIYDVLNILGFDVSAKVDMDIFHSYFLIEGVVPWTFTTFIGNFIYDFGKIWTLLFLCIMSLAIRVLMKKVTRTGILAFSNLLIFILLYQVVYWGVFYFRLYVANYYILFIILLCVAFKLVRSSRFSLLYTKVESESPPNNRFIKRLLDCVRNVLAFDKSAKSGVPHHG